jgi:hypothetical protein
MSTASVVITRVGPTMADVLASTEVQARAAGVCPVRRRLQSDSPTNECTASFVQMVRFCKSAATKVKFVISLIYLTPSLLCNAMVGRLGCSDTR